MKEHDKDSWEAKMRERLKNMDEAPDDKLWAGIEKNIRTPWYRSWPLAAAVLLLFMVSAGIWLYSAGVPGADESTVVTENGLHEKGKRSGYDEKAEAAGEITEEKKKKIDSFQSSGAEAGDPDKAAPTEAAESEGGTEADKDYRNIRKTDNAENPDPKGKLLQRQNAGPAGEGAAKSSKDNIPATFQAGQIILDKNSEPGASGRMVKGSGKERYGVNWPGIERMPPVYFLSKELIVSIPENTEMNNESAGGKEIVKPETITGNSYEYWGALNPMLTYRQVSPNQEDDIEITRLNNDSPLSVKRGGIQASAGVSYFISPRLALKAGAFYRYTQNSWSYQYLEAYSDSLAITAVEEGIMKVEPFRNEKVRHISEKHHESGLLAGIQYTAGTAFRRNVNVDFLAARNMASGQLMYYLSFDVDVERRLGERFFLYAGPSFIWGLNSASPAAYDDFVIKPYSLGLKLGISYRKGRSR